MEREGVLENKIVKYLNKDSKVCFAEVHNKSDQVLYCHKLLRPEQTKLGRDDYCGERELYGTETQITLKASDVVEYFPKVTTLESYSTSNGFIVRRYYNPETGILSPSLKRVCLCNQPLNPDFSFQVCKTCGQFFHESCLTDNFYCPDCNLPFKRSRTQSSRVEPKKQFKATDGSRRETPRNLPLDVDKYKNLPEENKQALTKRLVTIQNETQSLSSTSSEEKVRQQITSKLISALYLAYEENRASGCQVEKSPKEIKELAIEIEVSIYICTGSKAQSPQYKKKFRTLTFNLCDEKNPDFRSDILKGLIKPSDLCSMESRDMASSAIKNFREERQKKYTEEQLVMPHTAEKVMIKTHKGEAVLDVGEEEKAKPKEEQVDDPFNPDTHTEQVSKGRLYEVVKDWMPEAIKKKLEERVNHYLASDQANRILSQINLLNNNH